MLGSGALLWEAGGTFWVAAAVDGATALACGGEAGEEDVETNEMAFPGTVGFNVAFPCGGVSSVKIAPNARPEGGVVGGNAVPVLIP